MEFDLNERRQEFLERNSFRAEMVRTALLGHIQSSSADNSLPSRENINRLLEMGFTEENAKSALTTTRNNLSLAIELIMDNQLVNPEAQNDTFRQNTLNSNIIANNSNRNFLSSNSNMANTNVNNTNNIETNNFSTTNNINQNINSNNNNHNDNNYDLGRGLLTSAMGENEPMSFQSFRMMINNNNNSNNNDEDSDSASNLFDNYFGRERVDLFLGQNTVINHLRDRPINRGLNSRVNRNSNINNRNPIRALELDFNLRESNNDNNLNTINDVNSDNVHNIPESNSNEGVIQNPESNNTNLNNNNIETIRNTEDALFFRDFTDANNTFNLDRSSNALGNNRKRLINNIDILLPDISSEAASGPRFSIDNTNTNNVNNQSALQSQNLNTAVNSYINKEVLNYSKAQINSIKPSENIGNQIEQTSNNSGNIISTNNIEQNNINVNENNQSNNIIDNIVHDNNNKPKNSNSISDSSIQNSDSNISNAANQNLNTNINTNTSSNVIINMNRVRRTGNVFRIISAAEINSMDSNQNNSNTRQRKQNNSNQNMSNNANDSRLPPITAHFPNQTITSSSNNNNNISAPSSNRGGNNITMNDSNIEQSNNNSANTIRQESNNNNTNNNHSNTRIYMSDGDATNLRNQNNNINNIIPNNLNNSSNSINNINITNNQVSSTERRRYFDSDRDRIASVPHRNNNIFNPRVTSLINDINNQLWTDENERMRGIYEIILRERQNRNAANEASTNPAPNSENLHASINDANNLNNLHNNPININPRPIDTNAEINIHNNVPNSESNSNSRERAIQNPSVDNQVNIINNDIPRRLNNVINNDITRRLNLFRRDPNRYSFWLNEEFDIYDESFNYSDYIIDLEDNHRSRFTNRYDVFNRNAFGFTNHRIRTVNNLWRDIPSLNSSSDEDEDDDDDLEI